MKRFTKTKKALRALTDTILGGSSNVVRTLYSSLIFQSLIVLWVLSKLIPILTSRLPSE